MAARRQHVGATKVEQPLQKLEEAARSKDDVVWEKAFRRTFAPSAQPQPDPSEKSASPAPPTWAAGLRRFLEAGPEIGKISRGFV